jgi:hypothetical protein
MSKKRIEQMLQDCLDGYEAGLTPDECLSAYNGDRVILEPLLRQALSLRVAYASAPREEFRREARSKLMFAAGQDVIQALASEPDPDFVASTRVRFLNLAGAAAQEALRDVPPPRLAFWVNARRRLLETAAAPRPSRRFALAMRYGLSAAVVVIALAVATLAPFSGNSPQSADAELAVLELQISNLETQGEVSAAQLLGVTRRLNAIAGTLDDEVEIAVAQKLEGLTARSEVLSQAAPAEPALVQAQAELNQAQEKLRVFAASVAASPTQTTALIAPTDSPASPTAEATEQPVATATPRPAPGSRVQTALVDDDTYGLDWLRVSTGKVSFLIPAKWRLLNVSGDENGTLTLNSNFVGIDTGGETSVIIIVVPQTGAANASIRGTSIPLRTAAGETIDPASLITAASEVAGVDDEVALALHHFVLSIDVDTP